MNFGETYIDIGALRIFEPMVIVTNVILFLLCLLFFIRLRRSSGAYGRQAGAFMLLLGISGLFGAAGHAIQHQQGVPFFRNILFLMNAFSLLSVYWCFRFSLTYASRGRPVNRRSVYLVVAWIVVLLGLCYFFEDFIIIKVHAGIVLVYALTVHLRGYARHGHRGSLRVVYGILVSFLSILVHSLRLSFHEWFNYKDLAHVFMIVSLVVIYRGVAGNSREPAAETGAPSGEVSVS